MMQDFGADTIVLVNEVNLVHDTLYLKGNYTFAIKSLPDFLS